MIIRVSVAGGSPSWRRGMTAILEDAGYDVAAFEGIHDWKPGVGGRAIVAHTVEEHVEAAIHLHSRNFPQIPLLAVVRSPSVALVAHLIRIGAAGVLNEDDEVAAFPEAVGAALKGRISLPADVLRSMATHVPRHYDTSKWLSSDEAGWLKAMAEGRTVSDIADELGYSERAMFRMLRSLYTRLGVRNRTEALVWASRNGILEKATN